MSDREGDLHRPRGAAGTFIVAAIQATPAVHDRAATLERVGAHVADATLECNSVAYVNDRGSMSSARRPGTIGDEWVPALRHIAKEGQFFVVGVTARSEGAMCPAICPTLMSCTQARRI